MLPVSWSDAAAAASVPQTTSTGQGRGGGRRGGGGGGDVAGGEAGVDGGDAGDDEGGGKVGVEGGGDDDNGGTGPDPAPAPAPTLASGSGSGSGPTGKHICPWRGCGRSYGNAQRLKRHERIHTGALRYACTICRDKRYARSDILSRHMASAHGWASTGRGRPPKAACKRCIQEGFACENVASSRCTRCQALDVVCEYAGRERGKRGAQEEEQEAANRRQEPEPSADDEDGLRVGGDDGGGESTRIDPQLQQVVAAAAAAASNDDDGGRRSTQQAPAASALTRRRSEAVVVGKSARTAPSRRISAPGPALGSGADAAAAPEAGPGPRTMRRQQQQQQQRQQRQQQEEAHPTLPPEAVGPLEHAQSWFPDAGSRIGLNGADGAAAPDQLLLLADTAAQNRPVAAAGDFGNDFAASFTGLGPGLGLGMPSELPESIFDWGMTGWGATGVGDIFQPLNTQAPNTPVTGVQGMYPPLTATGPPFQHDIAAARGLDLFVPSSLPDVPAGPPPRRVTVARSHARNTSNPYSHTPGSTASPASGVTFASNDTTSNNVVMPREIPDGQPHDTPWPHVYKPQTADTSIDLPRSDEVDASAVAEVERSQHPSAASSSHPSPIAPGQNVLPEINRQAMLSLIRMCHQGPIWSEPDVGRFPSTTTLSVCVDLYFRHFQPCLPILDPVTFDLTTAPPVLVMAIAAIGSMYSQDGLRDLGVALNEIVRRSIIFIREYDRRLMYETHLVQAWLLQAYYGTFCGSPDLYQHSEVSRGGLVTAARRMHLLRPGISAMEELMNRKLQLTPAEKAEAACEDATRQRLGWGIYLYDSLLACLFNIPAQLSIAEVVTSFPWASDEMSFWQIVKGFLADGRLDTNLDPLGWSVISHTMYRRVPICADAGGIRRVIAFDGTDTGPSPLFPAYIKLHPQELLERFATSMLHAATSLTTPSFHCIALAYHSHMQFTIPAFLDDAKIAAGKSGTQRSRQMAALRLSEAMSVQPIRTRQILAGAGMLNALLGRYVFDSPSEVIWLFDTALTLWAILKFGGDYTSNSSADIRPPTVLSWTRTPAVDDWIASGGPLWLQGLGTLAELTPAVVLHNLANRLDLLCWGLAGRYRQVLNKLIMQEQEGD